MSEYLKALLVSDSISFNGAKANPLLYDIFQATGDARGLRDAAIALAAKVPDSVTVLVAPGLGAAALAGAVAMALLPRRVTVLHVRDPLKSRPDEKLVEGPIVTVPSEAAYIDDMIISSVTYNKTMTIMRQMYPQILVKCCLMVVNPWLATGARRLHASGVPVMQVFRRHDLGLTRDELSMATQGVKTRALSKRLHEHQLAYTLDSAKHKSIPLMLPDRVITADDSHTLRANAHDGSYLWHRTAARPHIKGMVQSLELQDYGTLIVASYNGNVEKVDAATGETLWSTKVSSYVHSTPRVDDGKIYVACEEYDSATNQPGGSLVQLAATGEVLQKHRYSDDYAPARCTVLTEIVIATANDGVLHAFDKADFTNEIWRLKLPEKVRGETLYSDGVLYCCAESGHTLAIDSGTGAVLWKQRTSKGFYHTTPIIHNGLLVVCDTIGYAHALDIHTGKRVWLAKFRSPVRQRPTPMTPTAWLFVGTAGDVHVVDPSTGTKRAQTPTGRSVLQPASYLDGKIALYTAYGVLQIWEVSHDLRS